MKVITEAILRDELRASKPASYTIPEGKILSPAAREYLQQCKIQIIREADKPTEAEKENRQGKADGAGTQEEPWRPIKDYVATPVLPMPKVKLSEEEEGAKPKFIDFETGAYYFAKPEHMTHLYGNVLVPKDHKRIVFRGKLDSLEALFVLHQATLAEKGHEKLIGDLQDILSSLREMMRCDAMNEPFRRDYMIGLTHEELREHSHYPLKYYKIKQMVLPDYTLGKTYAMLNQLRTAVRETEAAAAGALRNGKTYEHKDFIEELNRMSSAMHIIMCKYLAGDYEE